MEKNNNNIGIILISIGFILLIQQILDISIVNTILGLALGISLLYVYKSKNEKWVMPIGVFIVYWNISKILVDLGIISIYSRFVGLIWFVFAIIFIILYFEEKKLYLFNIGIILLSIGVSIYNISFKVLIFKSNYIFLGFYATMAIGLFLGYLLSNRSSRFNLYFSIICLFLSLRFLGFNRLRITVPMILIILGIILYFEERRKKIKKDEVINTENNLSNKEYDKFNKFDEFDN